MPVERKNSPAAASHRDYTRSAADSRAAADAANCPAAAERIGGISAEDGVPLLCQPDSVSFGASGAWTEGTSGLVSVVLFSSGLIWLLLSSNQLDMLNITFRLESGIYDGSIPPICVRLLKKSLDFPEQIATNVLRRRQFGIRQPKSELAIFALCRPHNDLTVVQIDDRLDDIQPQTDAALIQAAAESPCRCCGSCRKRAHPFSPA